MGYSLKIQTKVSWLVVLITIGGGVLSSFLTAHYMSGALEGSLQEKGVIIAKALAGNVLRPVINRETLVARNALVSVVEARQEVLFAYVTDFDGNLFAHSFPAGFPKALFRETVANDDGDVVFKKFMIGEDTPVLLIRSPLIAGMHGDVYVGIDQRPMFHQIGRTVRNIILTMLGLMLAGVVIGGFISFRITHPLNRLAQSMRDFGEGKTPDIIAGQGHTFEVNALTRAFERMAAERSRAEEQIKASLTEKEVLLKEVHHRVKNNLQMVSGLLSLQEKQVDDDRARGLYVEATNRIMSMALIHEELYGSKNLGRIDFESYLAKLAQNIQASFGSQKRKVRMRFDVDKTGLIVDTAIPVGLIVNELLTNSFKHAFPGDREGEVRIGFHMPVRDEYVLTVADDGVGFGQNTDIDSYRSLGLRLTGMLVSGLGGRMIMDQDRGTRFTITFSEYREAGTKLE